MRTVDRLVVFATGAGLGAAGLAAWLSGQLATTLLAGAGGFGAAYAGGLWLLKPMAPYVDFIQRLAEGEFDEEAPPARERRFAPLAQALEAMRLHLRAWMGQIARSAIEFEGSLQVLDLVHVMHFLRAGKRSGTLVLQRGGEMALQFWKGGEVVGALCGNAAGVDAFHAPFGWERGSFKFSPRVDPTANLSARWEILLLGAVRGVDNPRKWGRLVPKPSTVVRRTALADHMPLRQLLAPDEWAVWSALGGELSAEDVAARLGEPVHKVWHALYCLSALGLVEPVDRSALTGFAAATLGQGQATVRPLAGGSLPGGPPASLPSQPSINREPKPFIDPRDPPRAGQVLEPNPSLGGDPRPADRRQALAAAGQMQPLVSPARDAGESNVIPLDHARRRRR